MTPRPTPRPSSATTAWSTPRAAPNHCSAFASVFAPFSAIERQIVVEQRAAPARAASRGSRHRASARPPHRSRRCPGDRVRRRRPSASGRVALAERLDRIGQVATDRIRRLLEAPSAELLVDAGHAEVEEFHRDAALTDVGADEVGAVGDGLEQRGRAAALRGEQSGLGDEALGDEVGDDVRRGCRRQSARRSDLGTCGAAGRDELRERRRPVLRTQRLDRERLPPRLGARRQAEWACS